MFPDYPEAPADHLFGERQIRPAAILRKNSQFSRSDFGHDPTKTITDGLEAYLSTGQLLPLPD